MNHLPYIARIRSDIAGIQALAKAKKDLAQAAFTQLEIDIPPPKIPKFIKPTYINVMGEDGEALFLQVVIIDRITPPACHPNPSPLFEVLPIDQNKAHLLRGKFHYLAKDIVYNIPE